MPTPPSSPFSVSVQATFTDREAPQESFRQALAEIDQRDYSLLTFYGVGGIGKSCLQCHLKKAHLDKDDESVYSSVDFKVSANRQLYKTLETLVINFKAEPNIPFVAFGLAYIIYWKKAFPNQDIKKSGLPFLEEGSLLAGAADLADSVGGIASLGVTALSYLYDKAKQHTFDKDLRDALSRLDGLESNEIEERLPQFFAYDIQRYQNSPNSKKIVIFIDTYEALWQVQCTEANRLSQDQWIRDDLIARLPKVLFVISGREKIIWDEDKTDNWGDYLHNRQHLLGRLSDNDARFFLQSCAIDKTEIQDKMIADSEGVPYYLDLCIETFYKIKQQGKSPSATDFALIGKDKLFERFMRYLDRAEIETLKVLAHAQFYNRELFSLLIEEFKTGYPISALNQLNCFSFISQQQDQFYIHNLMRKSLIECVQQQDNKRSQVIYQFLFNYYNTQLQDLSLKNINERNLKALPEACYYKAQIVGAEALFNWFIKPHDILRDAAQYKPVLEIILLLKQRIKNELGQKHLYYGFVLHHLANTYHYMGKYDQMESLYQHSLKIKEKALGKDHPSVATTLNNLADLYREQGKYEQAEPLFQCSLEIREKVLGKDHPDVGQSLNNLAGLYYSQDKYEQAKPLYQRSLVIREKALGKDHPHVANSLNNLALLYDSQGKYEQAEPLYQRSLKIWEKALGNDHPDIAISLNGLAGLYDSQGKYEQAEPLYQLSLKIWKKALGKDHPHVASSLNNLAGLYYSQGKYEQAEPLYQRSLKITEKALGNDHPDMATSLNNLALLYECQGKYEQAEPLYQRSLKILEKVLGNDHPDMATSLNNLALLYDSQGKYKQAEPLYQRSLKIREKALGKDHPDVAISLNNLAGLYESQGKYEQAEPLYQQALIILKAKFPNGHPDIDIVQANFEKLKNKLKE